MKSYKYTNKIAITRKPISSPLTPFSKLYHTRNQGKKIVYLEFGIGFNTPCIIRYPFEQMTYQNEKATLIHCLNKEHPEGAKENKDKPVSFIERKLCHPF